jgi:hypothetical protein
MQYYTNIGPTSGPVRHLHIPGAIGVLEAPDHRLPIGTALCTGWDDAGLAVWRLRVRGADLEGPWVLIDRVFRPTPDRDRE